MLQGDVSEICRSNQYTYNFTAFSDFLGSVKFAKFFLANRIFFSSNTKKEVQKTDGDNLNDLNKNTDILRPGQSSIQVTNIIIVTI